MGEDNKKAATTHLSQRGIISRPLASWGLLLAHTPDPAWQDAQIQLEKRTLEIGREPTNTGRDVLHISDACMSRVHATIGHDVDDTVLVRDADSTNGSFVNGRRIQSIKTGEGDVIRLGDTLFVVVRKATEQSRESCGIYGKSAAIVRLRAVVQRVAGSDLPVLVIGPSGTGKELVAHAIHDLGRRSGPFIAVNCAALPDTLVENTLFGHKKGAYTHATTSEPGVFVKAQNGTVFLDEVGEMALAAQAKLLRALELGEITPVGSSTSITVDVRVVAATNQPLAEAAEQGTFRADLFSRLNGVTIETPTLRERPEDILVLFNRFLPDAYKNVPMSADFAEAMLVYDWSLNVRELKQMAARLPVLHPNATSWALDLLPEKMSALINEREPESEFVEEPAPMDAPKNADELIQLLNHCNGDVPRVAALTGRNRRQVYRWMKRFGVDSGAESSE